MMNRDEVIKGLTALVQFLDERQTDAPALRAAIALLQPAGDGEIEAARAAQARECEAHGPQSGLCYVPATSLAIYHRALDALAREPGILEQVRGLAENVAQFGIEVEDKEVRIAALEARLAEMREAARVFLKAEYECRGLPEDRCERREAAAFALWGAFAVPVPCSHAHQATSALGALRGVWHCKDCGVELKAQDAALAADAGLAMMAPTLPPTPWRGPIRCCECGGTEYEPRGLCGGALHPPGADAGPAGREPK